MCSLGLGKSLASWRLPWRAIWLFGAILGRSWGLLQHLRSYFDASYAILIHLGARLGLSEALLEPSYGAILDAPTRCYALLRPPPAHVQGMGVGGMIR